MTRFMEQEVGVFFSRRSPVFNTNARNKFNFASEVPRGFAEGK
jgi:hypothetical protein